MVDSNYKKDNLGALDNENIKKSVAVWLILKDGSNARKILLQKRLDTGRQSYPKICQPTWNEKLEEGEVLIDAIKRGAKEELGETFYNSFDFANLTQFGFDTFYFEGKKFISYNFVGNISEDQVKKVKMHAEAIPDFIFIGKEDLDFIKSQEDKFADTQKNIVLFKDQYNFLVKFLNSRQYYSFL